MNCDEVRELLPAYVLGALDAEELRDVEAHLRAGHEHDDELIELRATVFALDRYGDADDVAASGLVLGEAKRSGLVAWIERPHLWQAAAAAVLMVMAFGAGLLVSNLVGERQDQEVSILIQGSGGKRVSFLAVGSEESVTVTMAGFSRLPEAQAYQLWAIREGAWLPIGICNTNDAGGWQGDFEFRMRRGEQIALTIEPAEGSETPTSEPILSSRS
jgi:anti-sigma-K factor RskA